MGLCRTSVLYSCSALQRQSASRWGLPLQECFGLMDADGSGSIDVDEMWEAFQLLKIRVSRQMVGDMLAKVDSDGSGQHCISGSIDFRMISACRGTAACTIQHAPCFPLLEHYNAISTPSASPCLSVPQVDRPSAAAVMCC